MPPGLLYVLVYSAEYALVAAGFSLVYRTGRVFHFAHGAVLTCGAYSLFALHVLAGVPLLPAVPLALGLTSLVGAMVESIVYAPMRRKGAQSLTLLVASLGTYVVLQNIISLLFGDDTKQIAHGAAQGVNLLGTWLTVIHITVLAAAALLLAGLAVLMRATRTGKAMRAVANDADLARVSGVDPERAALWASLIAAALAGAAGMLLAVDVDVTPTMGMKPLMMGLVAGIVGGLGSVPGAALGALVLGLAQYACVWLLGSQWQDAGAFVILLVFLAVRPYGILGAPLRRATV